MGYGKDENGYMAINFGPLNVEGGERRLNVLISRAKRRCEVFSSITADDIDLERAPRRGVASFKAFLSFAQTGRMSVAQNSGRDEDSPFEEAVRRALESLGYEVHAQVGIAGFFIDLAVLDRQKEGRYLLEIECDGAAYHSSRSTRDRDRLRQAVLEAHGWHMHRIWSTDWFQRPADELRKAEEAIKRAKVILEEENEQQTPKVSLTITNKPEDVVERESVLHLSNSGLNTLATPYKEAKFDVPRRTEPHELPTKELSDILLKIVQQEGPIHEDEIVNRARDLWGFARAGGRIQDAVAKGVRSLLVTKRCTREEGFLGIPEAAIPIRTREAVSSSSLRKPEMLPPAEIRAAILAVIDVGHGATQDEIPVAVARLFGFKNTSHQFRSVIESQIGKLLRQGILVEANGMLNREGRQDRDSER